VESVAWISERKDLLYGFFYLAGLLAYLQYLKTNTRKPLFYGLTLVLFVLSILSKAPAVTLAVVLVLIDFYTKRDFTKKVILEKVPFFGIALFFGIVAIQAQQSAEAISSFESYSFFQRILFAAYGLLVYIYKFFVPIKLACFYPYPEKPLALYYYLAPIGVMALFYLLYRSWQLGRAVIFGFLFYLVTIALVLQLLPVGSAIIADRYTYLPYMGLAFSIGYFFHRLLALKAPKWQSMKNVAVIAFIGFSMALVYQTYQRCQVWKNSLTLWTDCIEKYPKVPVAYNNRGNYWSKRHQQYDRALEDYNISIQIQPKYYNAYVNRGNVHGIKGRHHEAIADYTRALELKPNNMDAILNRAMSYALVKEYDSALLDYNRAIQIDPNHPNIYVNRGYTYFEMGDYEKSIADYTRYLQRQPDNFNAWFYRGLAYFKSNQPEAALNDFTQALKLNPNHGATLQNRAIAHKNLGNYQAALQDAQRAQQVGQPISDAYMKELQRLAQ